ncbi:protein kinase domain containing protein [Theileria equi strain WA]|uniref:Protein kinase domain containing protein n=1 Tax=Theileria equi strain WA TaxID=1537102 RepID=L0AXL0_THEEQ|nr:protein kinase domain containing protein [Theileria equi strain WA]AFZ79644.1 protein kinase domain containing protein [Theileria equi strain WA]|eukprot:XP_004829310.1 protein kinase domain containing protein [Theileria equi strain WA]
MSETSLPEELDNELRLLSELDGIEIIVLADSPQNTADLSRYDDESIFFEASSAEECNVSGYKFELKIRLKECRYAIRQNRDTVISLIVEVQSDYSETLPLVEIINITNSSSKLTAKCEQYLNGRLMDYNSRSDRLRVHKLIADFYDFLLSETAIKSGDFHSATNGSSNNTTDLIAGSLPLMGANSPYTLSCDDKQSRGSSYGAFCRRSPHYPGIYNIQENPNLDNFLTIHSRYYREFIQEAVLGSGSFGCVTKVRKNGVNYAVKQIPIYESYEEILQSEAAILASLQHRNIVLYYDAWIEVSPELLLEKCRNTDISSKQLSILRQNSIDKKLYGGYLSSFREIYNREGDSNRETILPIPQDPGSSDVKYGFRIVNNAQRSNQLNKHKKNRESKRKSGIPKKYLFILMEYCAEATLFETISEHKLYESPQKVIELFRQILDALSYIHEKGIIHRDIKPSNIFLKFDGELLAKLGDFGLTAKLTHKATSPRYSPLDPTGMVGTLHYMAPEQIVGDAYDEKVDIYSAGVVLFEMLSPPFRTSMERTEILSSFSTLNKQWPEGFRDRVDYRLLKLLESMLHVDPNKRPSATVILQNELFSYSKLDLVSLYTVITQYPQSMESAQLLNGIFSRRENAGRCLEYLMSINTDPVIGYVNTELGKLYHQEFTARGAIRVQAPLFTEVSSDKFTSNMFGIKGYNLLMTDGRTCQLRFSVLVSLAESLPSAALVIMRRWHWGLVYANLSSNAGARYPKEFWRCAYDIIADYGIMFQENAVREEFLDAFFTSELISVSTKPIIKFLKCNLVVEWGYNGFIRRYIEYAFDTSENFAKSMESIFIKHMPKIGNAVNKQITDLCRSTYSNSDDKIQSMISLYSLLVTQKLKPHEFAANLRRLCTSTKDNNMSKMDVELENLLYMDKFLRGNRNIEFSFKPIHIVETFFSGFTFQVYIKMGKRELEEVAAGGCYERLLNGVHLGKNVLDNAQRKVFGFELNLQVIFDTVSRSMSKNTTGFSPFYFSLSPDVLILLGQPSLLIQATSLEYALRNEGIRCGKYLGPSNNFKSFLKMKSKGAASLQRLKYTVSLKLSSGTSHNQLPNHVQYTVFDIEKDDKMILFEEKQVFDHIAPNIHTRS